MPCDLEGGVLDDGTCQWGIPHLVPENVEAVQLWSDINLMGWDVATGLRDWELSPRARDEMLVKLRVLAGETRAIEVEKLEATDG